MNNRTPSLEVLRLRRLIAFTVMVALILFGKLVYFQVIAKDSLNKESLSHRITPYVIPAMRGNIVDVNGKILATTVMSYNVTVDPTLVAPYTRTRNGVTEKFNVGAATRKLATALNMRVGEVAKKLRGTSRYSLVAKQVDGSTYLRISHLDIPWVYFENVPHRIYPNGALAGNLLGFVGSDGNALEGIELSANKCLAGVNGMQTFQHGEDGIKIPGTVDTKVEPKNGGTLRLSIDSDLQYYAQQIMAKQVKSLKADWGTAIVIEAKTGRILAAAEAPTVDPNDPGAAPAEARSARIFRNMIEPGSTMKALTAATAIDTGLATPLTHVVAPQSTTVAGGFRISDSHTHPTEHLTLQGVLIESSNTGIIQVGIKVPYATRYDYWRKFGLGSATAVQYQGEAPGVIYQQAPDGATVYTSMFGQAMQVTPIQAAMAYQTFANDGVRLAPQLLLGCTAPDGSESPAQGTIAPTRVLKSSTDKTMLAMLENDVSQTGGIGSTARIPGYRIGGKTGTAQIANGKGGYGYLHAISFIGIAPIENPKYVVAITIFKPRTTSTSIGATPPFKAIMQQVLRAYRVPPSTTKSPKIPARW